MANRIGLFENIGGDAHRLHSFYADMFGWKIAADNEMKYGMVSDAEAGIGGGIGPDPQGGPGYVTIYISVDDINAAMAKAENLGATVVLPPMALPEFGVTFAQFADPAGHVVGLIQNS